MESFFSTVNQLVKLSDEGKEALSKHLLRFEYSKKHILVKQNSICRYIYFIEKGLTRTYYLSDGKDITDWISTENTFAVSILSFLTQIPDRRIIELLEDSVFLAISFTDLQALYARYHDIESLGRKLAELGVQQLQTRFDSLHFSSSEERYKHLLVNHPDYILRVPLGVLASFLGMTQETLSRIRSKS